MFDVCAMGDMAHIDTIFKLLSHMCRVLIFYNIEISMTVI